MDRESMIPSFKPIPTAIEEGSQPVPLCTTAQRMHPLVNPVCPLLEKAQVICYRRESLATTCFPPLGSLSHV